MPEHVSPKAITMLERMLEIPAARLDVALSSACDLVADALAADKVDAFLHDPARASLVALGTSKQPLSALQRQLGLDVLPIANGGRVVRVFEEGKTYWEGHVERDDEEVRGVKEALGVRSQIGVPLTLGGARRGVVMIASQTAALFTPDDVHYAEIITRWVGFVADRAQLVEEIARNAAEQGRRAVAEELITVLAHDLRNHLSPIAARLAIMRRRAEFENRPADVRDADLANQAMKRLSALISDILDVARVDQGGGFQLEKGPLDLGAVLEDACRVLSTPARSVVTHVMGELLIVADEARVRQCIENLVSNALKYSPVGVPVVVTAARETRAHGEYARVVVTDEGPGIPGELMARIFDRFVTSSKSGGLGLGLYLSKRIAVAHGGDLTVESAPGEGTRFTMILPVRPAE